VKTPDVNKQSQKEKTGI